MPTSPNPDPASKVASSVPSALSSQASKAASVASAAADAPTSELLRTVASEVRSLVQDELTSARREITEKALAARPAMAKLGAAAVLAAMAAGTSAATLARVSKDLEAPRWFPQAQQFSIFSSAYYPRQRWGAYLARLKIV